MNPKGCCPELHLPGRPCCCGIPETAHGQCMSVREHFHRWLRWNGCSEEANFGMHAQEGTFYKVDGVPAPVN